MPVYPLGRTYLGAICAILALLIGALGLLGVVPDDAKIMFVCVVLLAIGCLA